MPDVIKQLDDAYERLTGWERDGRGVAPIVKAAKQEIEGLREVIEDHKRLVRDLDVALNGDGAAPQASLCDIVGQVKDARFKLVRAD